MALQPIVSARAELSRSDYEACQAKSESELRSAIEAISAAELKKALHQVNYEQRVGVHWRELSLDETIDKRVDIAVEDVRNESSWSELLKSLTNSEQAQKLAAEVAERVYRSEPVTRGIENLASAVALDVGQTMELAGADAQSTLLDCLEAYVGPQYGGAVARVVAGDARKSMELDPQAGTGKISSTAVLKETTGGLAGATILIIRRQLANIARRVGQRIAGSVLSRVVSVVAGGVGLVLVAKDIWEFRNGVLPIIATEMKSETTKSKVQEEIAKAISTQIGNHVDEVATATAYQVLEVWNGFKRAHAVVLGLAEGHKGIRDFLNSVEPAKLPRLDEVAGFIMAKEGENGILRRLDDGSLNIAVNKLPDSAMQIARETQSVGDALLWYSMAPDKLGAILDYEIHKRASPQKLTRRSLERILELPDRTAIMRVAALPAQARDALLLLDGQELNGLARNLSETELGTLAGYLRGLGPGPREKILRAVARDPVKMQRLASARVREAIISSRNQSLAADMMLASKPGLQPRVAWSDAKLVWSGQVQPILMWEKHPGIVIIGIIICLFILLWLSRLFRFRRSAKATPETAEVAAHKKDSPSPDVGSDD